MPNIDLIIQTLIKPGHFSKWVICAYTEFTDWREFCLENVPKNFSSLNPSLIPVAEVFLEWKKWLSVKLEGLSQMQFRFACQ